MTQADFPLARPGLGALVLLASSLLSACGDSAGPSATGLAPSKPPVAVAAAPAPPARAEDALPPPACDKVAHGSPPGPDIAGLRLGMRWDEALDHSRCALSDGVLAFNARWFQQVRTGQVTVPPQGFGIQRGQTSACVYRSLGDAQKCGLGRLVWDHIDELISVAAPGLDSDRSVVGIWRQQHWLPGAMPARDAVLQALRDKYGREGEGPVFDQTRLHWRYDPAGDPLERADPLFQACGGIQARPGSQSWREGCGLSISAELVPPRDNPQLVQSLYVGMAHQERLLQVGDQMETDIARIEAARRASEVRQAAGTTPRL